MVIIARLAEQDDIPGIQAVAKAALEHVQPDTASSSLARLYSEDALKQALASEHIGLVVAESDGDVVGIARFATPILEDCDCEDLKVLHALLVHPEWSWRTIADELLFGVQDSLNENATIQRMAVYVDPTQRDLVRFYAHHGFHHEEPEDADGLWYMELTL